MLDEKKNMIIGNPLGWLTRGTTTEWRKSILTQKSQGRLVTMYPKTSL